MHPDACCGDLGFVEIVTAGFESGALRIRGKIQMHLTSHFSKLTRVLGLFAAACVISVTAVAQGPVKDVAGMTTAERKMDSALIDLTRASASGQLQAGRLQELPARVQDFAQQNVVNGQTIFIVIKGTVRPN